MKFKYILLTFLLLLTGCTTLQIPQDFTYHQISTPDFDLVTWQKITKPTGTYKIYIEGDGHAFNTSGMPTSDPTPRRTLVRQLAFADPDPNVIYMARVCQFINTKQCRQKYWTTGRFAPEVIAAHALAVKKISGRNQVILIGFSGGAQIAALLTVTAPEIKVKKVITIAGNLDHPAWTTYHHVPALNESLDLNDYKKEFALISQQHYVGSRDSIIPPFMVKNFIADTSNVTEIKGADHTGGWEPAAAKIYNMQ